MEKNYKLFFILVLILMGYTTNGIGQINLATSATATAYTPDPNGLYNWSQINDNNFGSCGTQQAFIWTSTSGINGTEYMQWDWTSAKSINKIRFHNAWSNTRNLSAADVYYWNGSSFSYWKTISIAQACMDSATFPTITTTKLRLTNFKMTHSGQQSNPSWREIEVISGPSVNVDMGVSALSPLDLCTNSQTIAVRPFNFGKKTCDSFRLYWSVNGTLQSPVRYITSRLGSAKDTIVVLSPSYSFANNTSYTFKFWTSKPNGTIDSVAANDTLKSILSFLGNPTPPSTTNFVQCGEGRPLLTCVPSSTGDTIVWYDAATGGKQLGIGKKFLGPLIKGTTTFYAQAMRFGGTSALNNGFTGNSYFAYSYSGGMFNVTPSKSILLDSITVRTLSFIPGTNIEVYYKSGTFTGNESNPAAWTRVFAGAGRTFASGGINYCRVSANSLNLTASQVYGFYVTTTPIGGNYLLAKPGSLTVSNANMTIASGTLIAGLFTSGGGTAANYSVDVEFTSKISCSNPNRTALTVTVNPRPIGADVVKGSTFQGQLRQGLPGQPDIVAPGKTIQYELLPPTGYTNADHGSKWIITSVEGRTKGGVLVPSSEFTTVNPSSTANGLLTFQPTSVLCDSVVTFSLKFQDLGPYFCDSTVTRTIKVAPTPIVNFSFPATICDGNDIVFNNLTTVGCGGANNGFANYKWYFADGDSSDLQNPVHLYKTYGCYPVKLVATSSPWGIVKDTTILVCVTEVPTVKFKVINACEGTSVKFINQTTIGSGTLLYEWDFGDASTINTTSNPSHLYAQAGGYKVTLEVSANGCESSLTKNAYQFAKPKSDFATALAPVCANTKIDFVNSTTISLGQEGSFWTYGDGNSSTLRDGYNAYKAPNTYNVKLKSVSEFGCTDSITKPVVIKPAPEPDFITNKLCSGEPTNFLNTTVETVANPIYTWTLSDNSSYSTKNITKNWLNEGTYKATLQADFSNGCSGTTTKDLVVLIQPAADFTVKDICSGEIANYVNLTQGDKGNIDYKWDLGNGFSTDGAPRRLYTPSVTTTYTVSLVASYQAGCSDTAVKIITVSQFPVCDFSVANQGFLKYQFTPANTTYTKYEWFFGEGGTAVTTSPAYTFAYASGFKVRMIATNAAGCKCEVIKNVSANTGVNNINVAGGINIFPNPNTGLFTVTGNGSNGMKIEVFNLLGSKILTQTSTENSVNINLNDAAKGIYLVKVTMDGVTTTSKVTVTN